MKYSKIGLIILALSWFASSCNIDNKHFITDREYRSQVEKDYKSRKEILENREEQLLSVFDEQITNEECEALKFLYAYMPYSDLADYDGQYFLNQVRYAFKARDYFAWGCDVPEEIFRHFVLTYRVNNENLDSARMVIFEELKDRIKYMTMYNAALEVNHWCHEKVTYRPSDGRTSSSLASIKTAFGRCGEESTFAVTALRAVGIPARQCYTPRWAHTDDNHAWVEVWVDGIWYFMGACEPDAKLNMGWFAFPSTRCMMVHSNAFGKYKGTEEVTMKADLFSRINMLPNYTKTKKITINVVDTANNPIENAIIKFKLYNYAEYYPIATYKTGKDGKGFLTTGYGDLLIWANYGNYYNYKKIDVRKDSEITIVLDKVPGTEYEEDLDIYPPEGNKKSSKTDQDEINKNNKRLQEEDSLRNAYLATFPSEEDSLTITNPNLTQEQIKNFILKSEGNYLEIEKFINMFPEKQKGLYLYEFISSLSDKDLRDSKAETLQQQVCLYNERYPKNVYFKGILPARIGLEYIRPWRIFLKENFAKILGERTNSAKIANWIKENIIVDSIGNYYNCPISPRGVFELKHSDKNSRNIFFVAVCRSMDIPAYMDNATGQLFVYENKKWKTVSFENEKIASSTGKLILEYDQESDIAPQYWTHYTIAKFENGDFVTFDYENDPRVANFPISLDLAPGYYMLSTGNRYSDGSTLSKLSFFNIKAGSEVKKAVELRKLIPRENEYYGKIDINRQINTDSIGNSKNVLSKLIEKNQLILCFIDPNREPTKHTLKEFGHLKTQFETWNGNILFVIPSDKQSKEFVAKDWNLPNNSNIIYDQNCEWMNSILFETDQEFRDNYPLIFIVNPDGSLVFKTEGYRIGTAELIYKSIKKENQ